MATAYAVSFFLLYVNMVLFMIQHVIDRLDAKTNYQKLPQLFRLVRSLRFVSDSVLRA
jgi:hypothetical protein